jgi:hypothetical protein
VSSFLKTESQARLERTIDGTCCSGSLRIHANDMNNYFRRYSTAQDPLGGAILGGATGAIIGGVAGGGRGAAIGAGVGAATGAVIAAEAQRRRGGYYWWRQGCYVERPNGAWVRVSSRYCG